MTSTGLKKATKARSLQVIEIEYFNFLVSLSLGGLKWISVQIIVEPK